MQITDAKLIVDEMAVAYGTVAVHGFAQVEAGARNVTTWGKFDGKGRSEYQGNNVGPGTTGQAATPGCTVGSGSSFAGSHGGGGGATDTDGRCIYGSTYQPVTSGTSAWSTSNGGAALKITAGELTHEGTIDMDGEKGAYDFGGSAGGSAWVTAGTLRGTGGTIRANGGTKGDRYGAAGGGGGRIALYCTTSAYAGVNGAAHGWELPAMTTHGGQGSNNNNDGSCGTVYVDCGVVNNTLLLDGGSVSAPSQDRPTYLRDTGMTSWAFDEVKLIGGTFLSAATREFGTTVRIDRMIGEGSRWLDRKSAVEGKSVVRGGRGV